MKVKIIKIILALAFSILLGFLCFLTAKEEIKIASFIIALLSTVVVLSGSFAIEYNCGARNINIKVVANLFTILIILVNFSFCFFANGWQVYAVIISLLTLTDVALIYALYKPKEN